MNRRFTVEILVTLATMLATTGFAMADTVSDCNQSRDGALRMKACTAIAADRSATIETRATALRHRASAHADQGSTDKAIADLSEALKLRPDYGLAYLARGQLHLVRKQPDAALADLDAAVSHLPSSAAAYNARGYANLAMGRLDNALADFSEAISIDPRSASARNNRGLAHRRKEQLDRAITDYTEAIRINPSYALAYANRASAYEAWGKKDEAAADYARAASLDPRLATAKEAARRVAVSPAKKSPPASADVVSSARGKQIAQKNCAWCHGILKTGSSPNPRAPEFRVFYTRHTIETLREPLSRRIATPHAEMPTFALTDPEIDSIIAYINEVTPRR